MTQFQCSAKLSKYLNKVEVETGRRIEFHFVADPGGLAGIPAGFKPHPSCITIQLVEGTDWGNPEHEHTIAHEATHGYLMYKLGYSYPIPKRKLTENEIKHGNLLWDLIDDIVVNRIIQKEGFPPLASEYLNMVEVETKAARNGSDRPYGMFSHDPLLKDRFMVLRYILAWGFMRYCDLEPYARKIINKYLKAFEKSFVKQFTMADQIREIILQHDIFSAQGHREAVEAITRLWHLEDLVKWQNT
jgi:hypothetical protein